MLSVFPLSTHTEYYCYCHCVTSIEYSHSVLPLSIATATIYTLLIFIRLRTFYISLCYSFIVVSLTSFGWSCSIMTARPSQPNAQAERPSRTPKPNAQAERPSRSPRSFTASSRFCSANCSINVVDTTGCCEFRGNR